MRFVAATLLAFAVLAVPALGLAPSQPDYKRLEKLYSGDKTIIGQTISYPKGDPVEIQSLIVTMKPGETTGWHKHGVPTYGYILSGQVTVDYGKKGKRTYRAGEAYMEAMDWWHDGANTGPVPVRILVVFMGAKGHSAVIKDGAPTQAPK